MNDDDFQGDMIRPFQLESADIRGRIVRFHDVLDDILTPHDYPDTVNQLLAEAITICSLLSSLMKYDGIFTLQISGDGPVSMVVTDMTSAGHIRGCATFDNDGITAMSGEADNVTSLHRSGAGSLKPLGKGYIAFTVDQGLKVERYQGIVELKGETLLDSLEHYFTQSEQIETALMVEVGQVNGRWRASGLMLQQMPKDGGDVDEQVVIDDEVAQEDWKRAVVLLQTCTRKELLDDSLNSHDILMRLFHEEGVRVFEPTPVKHQCRCSQERVQNVYDMLAEDEKADLIVDGEVKMTCDFCSTEYEIALIKE